MQLRKEGKFRRCARVYLKSRKYRLFLQTQPDFALKSLGSHKGFLRLYALHPACVCEISVISFVFRYTFNTVNGSRSSGPDGLFWLEWGGKRYWFESWKRQGYNPYDSSYRGKEIYDPASDAWYWLDNIQNGAMAASKDVYQESNGGKWVRYDENGHMVKGWDVNENGTYYFDQITGAMAKGALLLDDVQYGFDPIMGTMLDCQWLHTEVGDYWYEGGIRQGTEGRGKEIYDLASDAWYWLDAVDNGKKAVSKDVYQESDGGKWVRYDADGHMIKGWDTQGVDRFYFDPITGAMAKGVVMIDGIRYWFDSCTGALIAPK